MRSEQGQIVARATMRGPVDHRDFSGTLTNAIAPQHGMRRYDFRDGRAFDFECFCGRVFTDATQLSTHAESADA